MKDLIFYVKQIIEKLMKKHHLPGVAVALIDDQDVIWQNVIYKPV